MMINKITTSVDKTLLVEKFGHYQIITNKLKFNKSKQSFCADVFIKLTMQQCSGFKDLNFLALHIKFYIMFINLADN